MNQRRLAWTIWAFSVALGVCYVIADRFTHGADIGENLFALAGVILYATVGALITSRQAGNRVGLLFAWVGLSASISLLAGSYATVAQLRDLPLLPTAAWIGRVGFRDVRPARVPVPDLPDRPAAVSAVGLAAASDAGRVRRRDGRVFAHARPPRGRLRRADGAGREPDRAPLVVGAIDRSDHDRCRPGHRRRRAALRPFADPAIPSRRSTRASADQMAGAPRRLPRDDPPALVRADLDRRPQRRRCRFRGWCSTPSSSACSSVSPRSAGSRSCGMVCGTSTSWSGRPCSTDSSSPGSCSSSGSPSSWRRSCSSGWGAASMHPRSSSPRCSRSGSPWCDLGRAGGRTGSSTEAIDPVRGPLRVRRTRRGDLLDRGRPPSDGTAPR